jgi:hypothetical protein
MPLVAGLMPAEKG